MRIAVTYEDGHIFQHFGHTETFKIYEVVDNKVIASELLESGGSGHGALAELLGGKKIDVLICGGIGGGAVNALDAVGVKLVAGALGDADAAVEAFLKGELESTGANCDHHHEDGEGCGEHGCGHHEEGGGCGGCGGCGGSRGPIIEGPNAGKTMKVHYKGTYNDGTQFDSSYDRGEPLEFKCGMGMMIEGFDKAVVDMKVGEEKDIHLMPKEAYGEADPEAIFTIDIAQMPGAEELNVGARVYLQNAYGQPFPAAVVAKDEATITFDANHEMAGKELNFHIEVVEIQ